VEGVSSCDVDMIPLLIRCQDDPESICQPNAAGTDYEVDLSRMDAAKIRAFQQQRNERLKSEMGDTFGCIYETKMKRTNEDAGEQSAGYLGFGVAFLVGMVGFHVCV